VVDQAGKIAYVEYVPEVTSQPNFDAALAALKSLV
jgi:thiol peroxidase